MHFLATILTLLSVGSLALPSEEKMNMAVAAIGADAAQIEDRGAPQTYDLTAETVNMMASCPRWTIRQLRRNCDPHDTKCDWCFGIDEGNGQVTPCSFTVHAQHQGASRTDSQGHCCGKFTVSLGWSGFFGPGKGFVVLSVIDKGAQLIVWPGYTDRQLEHGNIVCPDQSYAPARLPA